MNFLIFSDFSKFFINFSKFYNDFSNLKLNFSDYLKHPSDVTRSGASDHVAINDRCEEATWQPMDRLIALRIKAVHLHLKRMVRGAIRFVGESFSK